MDDLVLLPRPRRLDRADGTLTLSDAQVRALAGSLPEMRRQAPAALSLRLTPELTPRPESYALTIAADGIALDAHDEAGALYGLALLRQLIRAASLGQPAAAVTLPCLRIVDWPDFPTRGVLLDVSRDKVPTMETLFGLVDLLAEWRVNQLQLYIVHTFAYRQHPEVWADASPFTAEEIRALDAFCRERHIELVPNQNSFGHMQPWLALPRYAALAETHGPFTAPWGEMQGPFSLCPLDPGSLALVTGLYDELLPNFTSRMLNVGCDETLDLGAGRSREACAQRGVGRVYLDFLRQLHRAVTERGRIMQFWGDIILSHPELMAELPKDAIALEWGYEADHPFAANTARFAEAGLPFYVCPGTSSWSSLAGRTDNALANLRSAAVHGQATGAIGYLNTDWGDSGHWQALPISYLGLAAGAAYAWSAAANESLDLASAISLHAFHDPTGALGRVAYDLGNVYRSLGHEPHNSSVLFWVLQRPISPGQPAYPGVASDAYERAMAAIEAAVAPLATARSARPDAALLGREFAQTAALLRHACRRARFAEAPELGDGGRARPRPRRSHRRIPRALARPQPPRRPGPQRRPPGARPRRLSRMRSVGVVGRQAARRTWPGSDQGGESSANQPHRSERHPTRQACTDSEPG